MLPKSVETTNSFTIKRFVGVGDLENLLKQNPSAKVYREVLLTFSKTEVTIELASVTREAANGGYCNGRINNISVSMETEAFLTKPEDQLTYGLLGSEPYVVLNKIFQIRRELAASREAVDRVIDLMANV